MPLRVYYNLARANFFAIGFDLTCCSAKRVGTGGEGRKCGIGAGRGGVFGAVDASAQLGTTKKACGFQDAGFGEEVFREADFRKAGFREAQPKEGEA